MNDNDFLAVGTLAYWAELLNDDTTTVDVYLPSLNYLPPRIEVNTPEGIKATHNIDLYFR